MPGIALGRALERALDANPPQSAVADEGDAPGWYGKLPTLGDFASRRLHSDFIDAWDRWLGDGLSAQRSALGEGWLDAYLNSPPWRFLLMPGVVPGVDPKCALAGVLIASVDRVGRYFPFTVAARVARLPRSAAAVEAMLGWLHGLEDLALDAMQDDWAIDRLEQALADFAPLQHAVAVAPPHLEPATAALADALDAESTFVAIDAVASRDELAQVFAAAMRARDPGGWQGARTGMAFWLADNPDHPQLLVSRGLPASADFVRMLGASGREAGAETLF